MTTPTITSLGSQIRDLKKKTVESKDYMHSQSISRIKDNEFYAEIIDTRVKSLISDIKKGVESVVSGKSKFNMHNGLISICHSIDKVYQAELLSVTNHDTTLTQYLNQIQSLRGVDISESITDVQNWMQDNDIPEIIVSFNSSNKSWDLPYNEFMMKI